MDAMHRCFWRDLKLQLRHSSIIKLSNKLFGDPIGSYGSSKQLGKKSRPILRVFQFRTNVPCQKQIKASFQYYEFLRNVQVVWFLIHTIHSKVEHLEVEHLMVMTKIHYDSLFTNCQGKSIGKSPQILSHNKNQQRKIGRIAEFQQCVSTKNDSF